MVLCHWYSTIFYIMERGYMKITVLVENTTCDPNLEAEHGLSLYLETGKKRILFDMGQTDLFARNAEKLGVDLGKVDFAVLSHGHYDHGGGLRTFLEINRHAPVYLSKNAFGTYYNGTEKYIGLDTSLAGIERLVMVDGKLKLGDGLTLLSGEGRDCPWNIESFGLNRRKAEGFEPDDFRHEQYLLVEEAGRRILISGCSHRGVLNIMAWFTPDVLVGGLHLSKIPPGEELANYAANLAGYKTEYYTGHCTGSEQYAFMKAQIPNLYALSTGAVIEM